MATINNDSSTPEGSELISLTMTNRAPNIAISGVIGNHGVENGRGWPILRLRNRKMPTNAAT